MAVSPLMRTRTPSCAVRRSTATRELLPRNPSPLRLHPHPCHRHRTFHDPLLRAPTSSTRARVQLAEAMQETLAVGEDKPREAGRLWRGE